MAELDQAVVNLQRFLGLVVSAVSAVGQVEEHVAENGRRFESLERDAQQHGGGLNDGLEALDTALEAEEAEAVGALGELARACAEAEQQAGDVDARLEQAAAGLDRSAASAAQTVEQADAELQSGGFGSLKQALETAQQELEASRGALAGALTELAGAAEACRTDAEAAWDESDAEVDAAAAELATVETALETEAQEGVQAFETAADAQEGACASLVTEVDGIYDALDAGVTAQGQEWEQAIDAAAQEAVAFVSAAREQRVEAAAQAVEGEALGGLDREYDALGAVLGDTSAPLGELEPLAADLSRAQAVVGQIDELMNALG